ncbi:thermonuclease family protein [Ponticaulis sp.]|uniref:thermonuclease family protein n=1 Tax=Ponticaulis sp. TaxID=2020902 RepID=UPI000B7369B5|nr:thermonuclease family protein [Ponticaulis sp.]MAI90650.1 hypothetical protein [Ponticaulis sp.]OUX99162.1 MAG: hypothetical protein CBB65_09440 [Hyphomonadaceae bacterium TMED5]|tara:strand:- start:54457 stop:55200 length:744 start_codon:yes stop_codon:yes gene_type:complete
MRLCGLLTLAALLLSACGQDIRDDWLRGEQGRVARVIDGDSLVLETGLVVRLVSVEAPAFAWNERLEHPYAEQSKRALERLTLGREVQLYYPGMTEDRYERALAQVYVSPEAGDDIWVNLEMIERGAAWVRLYADTAGGSELLLDAEDRARMTETGLWERYSPFHTPDEIARLDGEFAITQGRLVYEELSDGSCEYQLAGEPLRAEYDSPFGDCLENSEGEVELRGWIRNGTIYVGAPQNIRSLPAL